ncbi:type IVB secretion system protein IcmH/DotU [Photobacterium sp. OFAV2-7]|uniref:type IVB secretion system protein IcmH/DotU n=1 Tax=Photobacterium sp. OFAV2-7 TaxID=2917748 RepID=UPI001EF66271|nr:type IVB secretion system protein IcmH/DotU [Photobacterium sp. OFAV2-7]MCG7586376.1 type IVB secretion system protein IcmH/DotU [Photobacterium sp. OFAV2-7]
MTSLFNEQETIAIRRPDPVRQAKPEEKLSPLDLSGTEKLIEQLAIYRNPLLNNASELLSLLVSLPRQGSPLDIDGFRQQLLDAIADYKQRGLFLDYHPSVIEKSCFVICAAFDETILYTSWGEKSRWENHSLLSKVFNQRDGGEVFFHLLDQARRQPAKLVDFLELQYVLIMLGFLGKYRHSERQKINELKSELYTIIRYYREESVLLVPKTPELPEVKKPWCFLSAAKLLFITLLVLLGSYIFSEYWYHNRSEATLLAFSSLKMEGFDHGSSSKDLVYVSTDEDLGLAKADKEQQPQPESATPPKAGWEVLLAGFAERADGERLEKDLKAAGYPVELHDVADGTELIVPNQADMTKANLLKNELNVRFGLNATVRRNRQ